MDVVPPPYKNDMMAKSANNGAIPPDLSLMAAAREGGINYIFSLLTGYGDEIPPGVVVGPGQAFNPFFEGGVLSMPPPLKDGMVTFADGTPATISQMAKDVSEFLNWVYRREMDLQKQIGAVGVVWSVTAACFLWWVKQHSRLNMLCQRITYKNSPWGAR